MNIQKELLTKNIFSRPGKPLIGVKGIVMHWVANPGSSAVANRNYFENLKSQALNETARYASAHFIIGISGDIVQCVPTNEMAYHVGAKKYTSAAITAFGHIPNNCAIGIELCHFDSGGEFSKKTLESAAELCSILCGQFSLEPLRDIWTHHQVTEKICPKWFVEHPDDFAEFKNSVQKLFDTARGKV